MAADDPHRITTLTRLREVVGEPTDGVELKVYDHLMAPAVAFIALSPLVVLSTADAEGHGDASPKGDAPGFVAVEDEHTLLIPDRTGNRLAYGLQNLLANPRVGCLFLVPGTSETLRVNGTVELRDDPDLLARFVARGRPPVLVIRVHVEQCFFHCSKAFVRSDLWKPDTWPERQRISFGKMFAERLGVGDDAALADAIDESIAEDARTNL